MHSAHCSRRRRNATSTTTWSASKKTSTTVAPERPRRRLNAIVTRTGVPSLVRRMNSQTPAEPRARHPTLSTPPSSPCVQGASSTLNTSSTHIDAGRARNSMSQMRHTESGSRRPTRVKSPHGDPRRRGSCESKAKAIPHEPSPRRGRTQVRAHPCFQPAFKPAC